jgi:hypothetical protein
MNYAPTTVIVTSKDGVQFAVATDVAAAAYERAFAAKFTAAELDKHGDFARLYEVGQMPAQGYSIDFAKAPRPRPQLTLIKGGKS